MFERLLKFIMIRLGKTTPEDLTVKACIEQGMKVGKNCHGLTSTTLDFAHCWLIEIGDNVTFAPQVYLLAHDASTKRHLDYTKIARIIIEDNVFIGARALIMPGVTIGKNAVVAAGSIITKSIPEGTIVAGNPARVIGKTKEYIEKHKVKMGTSHVYDWKWTLGGGITPEMSNKMSDDLRDSIGYVK